MPIDAGGSQGAGGDTAGALLLITSYGQIWEVISALNSSPWTAESFGADTAKAKSALEYLAHSTASGGAMAAIAARVSRSWWPLIGAGAGAGYAWWIYTRALRRATKSGSDGWGAGQDTALRKGSWGLKG